jgi:hypothetical protein
MEFSLRPFLACFCRDSEPMLSLRHSFQPILTFLIATVAQVSAAWLASLIEPES